MPFIFVPVERNVPTIESIRDREVNKFFEQKHKKARENKPSSFWTVLRQNLSKNG